MKTSSNGKFSRSAGNKGAPYQGDGSICSGRLPFRMYEIVYFAAERHCYLRAN